MPRDCALEPELSRKTGKPKAGRGGPLPVFRGEAYRLLDYRGGFPTADEQGWNTLKALAAAELRCGVSKATARLIVGCLGDWFLEEEDLDWLVEQASRLRRIGPGIGKMMGMTRAEQVACGATHLHSTDGPSASERRKEDGKVGRRKRRMAEAAKRGVAARPNGRPRKADAMTAAERKRMQRERLRQHIPPRGMSRKPPCHEKSAAVPRVLGDRLSLTPATASTPASPWRVSTRRPPNTCSKSCWMWFARRPSRAASSSTATTFTTSSSFALRLPPWVSGDGIYNSWF